MAPTKVTRQPTVVPARGIATRNRLASNNPAAKESRGKRKADGSPTKEMSVKRSALGEITNNTDANATNNITKGLGKIEDKKPALKAPGLVKKVTVSSKILPSVKTVIKPKQNENSVPLAPGKVQTRASLRKDVVPNQTAQKPKESSKENLASSKIKTKRLSNEFEKSEESLYQTALEEISVSSSTSSVCSERYCFEKLGSEKFSLDKYSLDKHSSDKHSSDKHSSDKHSSDKQGDRHGHMSTRQASERLSKSTLDVTMSTPSSNITLVAKQMELVLNLGDHEVPTGVNDFDKENWDDIFQISHYAMDIFNYMKEREHLPKFVIGDYMERQICLSKWMRSLLVDWMVEVQESFELNHETLYLGVKLVDLYLGKVTVSKETLQLVGASAMFIASKFDERIPPLVDDFLYICDGAYSRRELLRMEINMLKMIDFDLGIPLSYRFLRRYARTAKVTMPILTLARYILELSLMDYSTVILKDSKLASATLFLALQMKGVAGGWTKTLQFYTGYKYQEIETEVRILNEIVHKKPKEQLMTVRNKYSHKIFFEVAKTPLIDTSKLKP